MTEIIEVNGKRITLTGTSSRFKKSFTYLKNEILIAFARIGIEKEYVTIEYVRDAAEVVWFVNGKRHSYRCGTQERFIDNLGCIAKVIVQDCYAVRNGMKSFAQVMNQFRIEGPSGPVKKSAREVLELKPDEKDWDFIEFKYKRLAKVLHPDTGGDSEKFKELIEAYEELKKELGK